MPKLEILKLGLAPCRVRTGATVKGLIDLASRCPHLLQLRVHFQTSGLLRAASNATETSSLDREAVVQRKDCALTDLEVGDIPILEMYTPGRSAAILPLILLQIFPCILNVEYTNPKWERVAKTIKDFRRIGAFVGRTGKVPSFHSNIFSDALSGSQN
jgi:hypothetical protein